MGYLHIPDAGQHVSAITAAPSDTPAEQMTTSSGWVTSVGNTDVGNAAVAVTSADSRATTTGDAQPPSE